MKFSGFLALSLAYAAAASVQEANYTKDATDSGLRVQDIGASSSIADIELSASRRALLKLKDALGPEHIADLLEPDIEHADAAWHRIVTASSRAHHVLAEAHLEVLPVTCNQAVNLTAAAFLDWFARGEPENPHKNTGAHPEHYAETGAENPDGTLRVDVLEAWGSLITRYVVPRYGEAGSHNVTKKPWMKELRGFPHQFVGEAVLKDGSELVIGDIHNSFRDLKGDRLCGIEAVISVWLPSAVPDEVVQGLREHQAVEFSNWMAAAYEDIRTGAFVPS